MYFIYSEEELCLLKKKDKKLASVIDKIGKLERRVRPDLFLAVIYTITGQQISMKAHRTIWERLENKVFEKSQCSKISSAHVCALSEEEIQSCGMSLRKARYILDFSQKVEGKEFDIHALQSMSDEDVVKALSSLKGIGAWTAEMIMLFSMQRPDILSFGDLAILRGLRMLYQKEEITKEDFKDYKKKFSPYGSIASFYLWEIAGGKLPEFVDPPPAKEKVVKSKKSKKIGKSEEF